MLAVGDAFLDGQVEFRAGEHEAAFAALRTAVARSEHEAAFAALRTPVARNDALRYDEPWSWMMPPRHGLGALLMEAGRFAEAEQVYRDDLVHHPDNGWALHGFAECLHSRAATPRRPPRANGSPWGGATPPADRGVVLLPPTRRALTARPRGREITPTLAPPERL